MMWPSPKASTNRSAKVFSSGRDRNILAVGRNPLDVDRGRAIRYQAAPLLHGRYCNLAGRARVAVRRRGPNRPEEVRADHGAPRRTGCTGRRCPATSPPAGFRPEPIRISFRVAPRYAGDRVCCGLRESRVFPAIRGSVLPLAVVGVATFACPVRWQPRTARSPGE